jgi:uncharacterized DUF497 family protein
MRIDYDPVKRDQTLTTRGLDMALVAEVFLGPHLTIEDDRRDYGEPRFVTVGLLRQRLVFIAWTPRGDARPIISLRKANDREIARFGPRLRDDSGR